LKLILKYGWIIRHFITLFPEVTTTVIISSLKTPKSTQNITLKSRSIVLGQLCTRFRSSRFR